MGIKFGEIDANQIIENELRISLLEEIIGYMGVNNGKMPPIEEIIKMKESVSRRLKSKYPQSIKLPTE